MTSTMTDQAPIHTTIEQITSSFQYMSASSGSMPAGWQLCADVVNDPEAVEWWLNKTFEIYGMQNRQVAASFLVLGYFWQPVVAAMGCFLMNNRMPDLEPAQVALNPRAGVCFLSRHCLVLPADPEAGHPDVTVVADRDALRAYMMHTLTEQHATPLFNTLRSVAPYGLPAMRANYLDRIASAIIILAEQLGEHDIARREVPAFMAHAGDRVRTGVIPLEHAGRSGVFLKRGGCCLNYKLPGREKCDTCSLIPMDQRIAGLKLHLTGE